MKPIRTEMTALLIALNREMMNLVEDAEEIARRSSDLQVSLGRLRAKVRETITAVEAHVADDLAAMEGNKTLRRMAR